MLGYIFEVMKDMAVGELVTLITRDHGTDILAEVAAREAEQVEAEALVQAVANAANSATWAIDGRKVILSRKARERIAAAVADGELPGDLAGRALKAGWPTPVCHAVVAYGRAVRENVAKGRAVNRYWAAA